MTAWTAAIQHQFLAHLAATGNVRQAARLAGVNRDTCYEYRQRDPAFAQAWEEALLSCPARPNWVGSLWTAEEFWAVVARCDHDYLGLPCPYCCWEWCGPRQPRGYGRFFWQGQYTGPHRVAWELFHGQPMAPELSGCHHCDHPPCCNPLHIFPGTHTENMRDGIRKGRVRLRHFQRGAARQGPGGRGRRLAVGNTLAAKLTVAQVLEIRQLAQTGTLTWTEIGRQFGVHRNTAKRAALGVSFRGVSDG